MQQEPVSHSRSPTEDVYWWTDGQAGLLDEYDTPAEVDAVFRTQRRIAFSYLAVFLLVVLIVPVLTLTLDWWSSGQLIGSMSPNFAMAAIGLYVIFFAIGLGASTLASTVEDRMLGSGNPVFPEDPQPAMPAPPLTVDPAPRVRARGDHRGS